MINNLYMIFLKLFILISLLITDFFIINKIIPKTKNIVRQFIFLFGLGLLLVIIGSLFSKYSISITLCFSPSIMYSFPAFFYFYLWKNIKQTFNIKVKYKTDKKIQFYILNYFLVLIVLFRILTCFFIPATEH